MPDWLQVFLIGCYLIAYLDQYYETLNVLDKEESPPHGWHYLLLMVLCVFWPLYQIKSVNTNRTRRRQRRKHG